MVLKYSQKSKGGATSRSTASGFGTWVALNSSSLSLRTRSGCQGYRLRSPVRGDQRSRRRTERTAKDRGVPVPLTA